MQPEFWHECWAGGRIGFHRDTVNTALERWWPTLDIAPSAHVLVPLAGKTVDLAWLAERGHQATGVELSERAVRAWFDERELTADRSTVGGLQSWRSGGVRLLQGDIFDTTPEMIGATAFYDRAATVALPHEIRHRYARHLARLLPPGARGLLVTFDYPQEERNGPPFSIDRDEVHALYAEHFELSLLEREPLYGEEPGTFQWGMSRVHRDIWALTRRTC